MQATASFLWARERATSNKLSQPIGLFAGPAAAARHWTVVQRRHAPPPPPPPLDGASSAGTLPMDEAAFWSGTAPAAAARFGKLKPIAAGQYGTVVKAVDLSATGSAAKNTVAIKRIGGAFVNATEALKVAREVRLLEACQHPNIIKLRAVLEPADISHFNEVFLVMDFGAGAPWAEPTPVMRMKCPHDCPTSAGALHVWA